MSYTKVFHNVKAAIKAVCTGTEDRNVFYNDCSIPGAQMLEIVKNKEFWRLPPAMSEAAQEAYDVLLHTGDGQLCDVIVDRAALKAISEAGRNAEDAIIRDYAESAVAIADIKIAVRSQKTGKSQEFLKRALAPCDTVQVELLAKAAANGMDAIRDYLLTTAYAGGAEALAESPSAFERWCDNRMIETMRPQKYQAFSVGPLVAYIVARENEIKTVRIILTGKQNQFPEEAIRKGSGRCMDKIAVIGDYDGIYGSRHWVFRSALSEMPKKERKTAPAGPGVRDYLHYRGSGGRTAGRDRAI